MNTSRNLLSPYVSVEGNKGPTKKSAVIALLVESLSRVQAGKSDSFSPLYYHICYFTKPSRLPSGRRERAAGGTSGFSVLLVGY